MKRVPVFRVVMGSALGVLTIVAGILAYRMLRADVAAGIYRERLATLAGEYDKLEDLYNTAIKKTHVTELIVRDGRLSVRIRSALGLLREIPTDLDPSREVYVDYVVMDGRLWIRRVFDSATPPDQALVIDPGVGEIDWTDPAAGHGKAVYRRLEEGRWIVSVTGNGALGLSRAEDDDVHLSGPPEVRDFDSITTDADAFVEGIGLNEVWARLVGG
ncbi:MAG: hypothetical protein H6811_08040 [Phycisphaeraceae bacterium]|nr:hypothetical protein [Phycisphaeraceae bacterium]